MSVMGNFLGQPFDAEGRSIYAEGTASQQPLPEALQKLILLRDHIQETIGFTFSARIKAEMGRTLMQLEAEIQRLLQTGTC